MPEPALGTLPARLLKLAPEPRPLCFLMCFLRLLDCGWGPAEVAPLGHLRLCPGWLTWDPGWQGVDLGWRDLRTRGLDSAGLSLDSRILAGPGQVEVVTPVLSLKGALGTSLARLLAPIDLFCGACGFMAELAGIPCALALHEERAQLAVLLLDVLHVM